MSTDARDTLKIVAELIQQGMQLGDGIVTIYNQKRNLGKRAGFLIDVSFLGARPFSVRSKAINDPARPDLVEIQTTNQQETVQVDIFSYDDSARLRKVEIIFALSGIAAQQASEKYALKIGRIPAGFVDLSEDEGPARLNRYALTFNILRAYSVEKSAQTFSTFENPPTLLVNQ